MEVIRYPGLKQSHEMTAKNLVSLPRKAAVRMSFCINRKLKNSDERSLREGDRVEFKMGFARKAFDAVKI